MRQVSIVGPNPALDIVLEVPGFVPGESLRARRSLHNAGGKPMNVARALRRLGIGVRLVSPLGGEFGARRSIEAACAALGIDLRASEVREETRTCVVVADTAAGVSTVVNEIGPTLSPAEAIEYERLVASSIRRDDLVLVSGSLPPVLLDDFYARVVRQARSSGARVIADTSGEPLRAVVDAEPWAIKINADEALSIVPAASAEAAARELGTRIEHVVVTMGAEDIIYVNGGEVTRIAARRIVAVNTVAAGDIFLAGLAAGLVNGRSWVESLRLGAEAAAIACARFEPDIGVDHGLRE